MDIRADRPTGASCPVGWIVCRIDKLALARPFPIQEALDTGLTAGDYGSKPCLSFHPVPPMSDERTLLALDLVPVIERQGHLRQLLDFSRHRQPVFQSSSVRVTGGPIPASLLSSPRLIDRWTHSGASIPLSESQPQGLKPHGPANRPSPSPGPGDGHRAPSVPPIFGLWLCVIGQSPSARTRRANAPRRRGHPAR